ncbi:hypothetical protein CRG98_015215 [Punica granatum]|uniref:RNase H type-1 domain-containing protein n=1 Tax=Punica granatum TaxID=22663 RepID=A0A2I0K724_PUNGR|nr:hypothetical protein CRG98_015215 [Punica granatum]
MALLKGTLAVEDLRDDCGAWLFGFAQHVGITCSFSAELWAVRTGLQLAWDLGHRKVILEVDSAAVVHLLQTMQDSASTNGALLQDIRSLLDWYWSVMMTRTLREGNLCMSGPVG